MVEEQREPFVVAAMVAQSAVYHLGVLAAALIAANHIAVALILVSAGLGALCYMAQLNLRGRGIAALLFVIANTCATLAGVWLLKGYLT